MTNLIRELRVLFDSGEEVELNAALMMILEACYRGVGLDRVLFCLVNGERTHVQARLGVGADVERTLRRHARKVLRSPRLPRSAIAVSLRSSSRRNAT